MAFVYIVAAVALDGQPTGPEGIKLTEIWFQYRRDTL
jgi:hypothetical protein